METSSANRNPGIRVVFVDDHRVILDSFSAILALDDEIELVGAEVTAEQGADAVLRERPDVALFDVDFPGRDSFDLVPELTRQLPETKFLFLTGHLSDVFVSQAIRMNARGYLLKDEPAKVVVDSIKRVSRGNYAFSAAVQNRLVWNPVENRYDLRTESMLCSLSIQQLSILRHLARGESVKEIAVALGRSEKSIDSHKYRIMHRLGIHDRVELCRYAIREGLALV